MMFRHALAGLILCALTACGASPPIHYHALSRPSLGAANSGQTRILVEILPIAAPERLSRPDMVVTDAKGQITVLDGERWLSPVTDDLRQIVGDALWRTVRATDSYQAPIPSSAASLPQYRLALRLERFDAIPGQISIVDGSWTIRRLANGPSLTCRWATSIALTGQDAGSISLALSQGSRQLAEAVAVSLRDNACPDDHS